MTHYKQSGYFGQHQQYISVVKSSIAEEPWSVWIGGTKIASDLASSIYDLVHSDKTKSYWGKKDAFPRDSLELVD